MSRRKVVKEDTDMIYTSPQKNFRFMSILIVLGIVMIAGAVFLGRLDNGQIDVNRAIEHSNQLLRDSGNTEKREVETVREVFKNQPNGGLVPQQEVQNDTSQEIQSTELNASNTRIIQEEKQTEATEANQTDASIKNETPSVSSEEHTSDG